MADKKNGKGKNKKSKTESFSEGCNEQAKPKIEAESNNNNNNNTQNDVIGVVPPVKKKWNWDTLFNRGGQIANIILAITALFLIKYTVQSMEATTKAVTDNTENFKVQNMPYLQVGNFRYVNDTTLAYSLFNLNQYPAKIATIQLAEGNMYSGNPLSLQTQVSGDSLGRNVEFKPVYDPLAVNV